MQVKNYIEFINESLDLILESNIVFSDDFKKVLSKIDDPLSDKILGIENKDLTIQSNYFDIINTKNDKLSFTPDRKVKEILDSPKEFVKRAYATRSRDSVGALTHNIETNGKMFSELGYEPSGDSAYTPTSAEIGEVIKKATSERSGKEYGYIKFENGQGVYNMEKFEKVDMTKSIWSKSRQELGIGRAVRAMIIASGEKAVDKEIETFVNKYKMTIDKMNDKFAFFDLVTGDDIAYWYKRANYYENIGALGGSCMAGVPARYLEIYTANKNQISLLILKSEKDESKILGRALLWVLKSGKKFLDRIYTSYDSDVNLFKEYAKENGWYSKYLNGSSSDNNTINPDGKQERIEISLDLEDCSFDSYPYLDTLKFLDLDSGHISTNSTRSTVTLEDTGGGYVRYVRCEYCNGSGQMECEDCGGSGETECDNCRGSGNEECGNCEGSGEEECGDCNGKGESNCTTCDGIGTIEDDGIEKECGDCGGTGKEDCSTCGSSGEVKCGNCGGRGEEECGSCDGDGEIDCGNCRGRGTVTCDECN